MMSSGGCRKMISLIELLLICCLCPSLQLSLFRTEARKVTHDGQDCPHYLITPLVSFSTRLLKAVRNETKSAIISPLSIHQAFSMMLLGTGERTNTYREMANAIGYTENYYSKPVLFHKAYSKLNQIFKELTSKSPDPHKRRRANESSSPRKPVIDTWNMIVSKEELEQEFQDNLRHYYNSSAKSIKDGDEKIKQVVDDANKWGKEAGFGRELMKVDELKDNDLILMLLSALRVETNWLQKSQDDVFSEVKGKDFFYNHDDPKKAAKETTLVSARQTSGGYLKVHPSSSKRGRAAKRPHNPHLAALRQFGDLKFEVGELRLAGDLNFVIFHPEHGKLKAMIEALDEAGSSGSSKMFDLLDALDLKEKEMIHVKFPKFRIDIDTELNGIMKSLGIKRAFERDAEFNLMVKDTKELRISKAKHQAFIQVDRNGVQAAALTKVGSSGLSLRRAPHGVNFEVKNPFMFLLRYKHWPLFIGQFVAVK